MWMLRGLTVLGCLCLVIHHVYPATVRLTSRTTEVTTSAESRTYNSSTSAATTPTYGTATGVNTTTDISRESNFTANSTESGTTRTAAVLNGTTQMTSETNTTSSGTTNQTSYSSTYVGSTTTQTLTTAAVAAVTGSTTTKSEVTSGTKTSGVRTESIMVSDTSSYNQTSNSSNTTEAMLQNASSSVENTTSQTGGTMSNTINTVQTATAEVVADFANSSGELYQEPYDIYMENDTIEFVGEFEDVVTDLTDPLLRDRSQASGNKTLHLVSANNKAVYLKLCVKAVNTSKPVNIQLTDIVYSNDGDNDTITFQRDGVTLGQFMTTPKTNWGAEWNHFKSTGPIGPVISLLDGTHNFTLLIDTDVNGVELDNADFMSWNQERSVNLLCEAQLKKRP